FRYRLFVTPTRLQYAAILHFEQSGLIGLQRFCPYATSRSLKVSQYRRGNFFRSAISVSSAEFVATYPRRFEIRCTCVSTAIPAFRNAIVTTILAVFRPTSGNSRSSSKVEGTDPPCFS